MLGRYGEVSGPIAAAADLGHALPDVVQGISTQVDGWLRVPLLGMDVRLMAAIANTTHAWCGYNLKALASMVRRGLAPSRPQRP